MEDLKGKITISKVTSNIEPDFISITIVEAKSRCKAIEAKLSFENFTKALTGQGHIDCDLVFNDSGVIGKTREIKHEIIPRPESYKDLVDDNINKGNYQCVLALQALQIDGWEVRRSDIDNFYNWVGSDKVKVLFIRYI